MKTETVVLAGLESAGKSALFHGLTAAGQGEEANFRGSTVVCRKCHVADCGCEVVDTPGIRVKADAETTRLALDQMGDADVVLLVARGTHASEEIGTLIEELDLHQKRTALAITFRDKAPKEVAKLAEAYRQRMGIPVVTINARELDTGGRDAVLEAIREATEIRDMGEASLETVERVPVVQPQTTLWEHPWFGPLAALATMALMYALPVYGAYLTADAVQPVVDRGVIEPLVAALSGLPGWGQALLVGDYGLLTLGWYSFLWAFPVVALIGLSTALAEETGVKDRITAALDPWLRRIGLHGRDLIPVLSGFGCNVVAVHQSRACSQCTRKACVSMIAFGSACSYQIGASLSVLSAAGYPGWFAPYLLALFVAGALHVRLFHGALARAQAMQLHERSFLQKPRPGHALWRVRQTVAQFLAQAMPIFLGICVVAALLDHLGVVSAVSRWLAPMMGGFGLPGEVAPAVIFSVLRKDALLILNADEGALLVPLSGGQVLVLVWLASTMTACLVTLWTIGREFGLRSALVLAGRQAVTSVVTTFVLALMVV